MEPVFQVQRKWNAIVIYTNELLAFRNSKCVTKPSPINNFIELSYCLVNTISEYIFIDHISFLYLFFNGHFGSLQNQKNQTIYSHFPFSFSIPYGKFLRSQAHEYTNVAANMWQICLIIQMLANRNKKEKPNPLYV